MVSRDETNFKHKKVAIISLFALLCLIPKWFVDLALHGRVLLVVVAFD